MNTEVYFSKDSWKYLKREVNLKNFTISYVQMDGYKTKQLAEKAQLVDEQKYEKDLKRIKKIANIQYTFREYVDYWLKEVFIKNTDSATGPVGVWAVRNLIMPNIQQDILISYVTADYINDIIKRCIPICNSAGEATVKYMRKILYSAYAYGFIKKDIRSEITNVKRNTPKFKLLNQKQLKLLIQEASKHPGYYLEILLGLFAGLRGGEVRGLKYDDFDKQNRTIRISRQYTTHFALADNNDHFTYTSFGEEKKPKADSYRLLRVPDFIFEEFEKRKEFNAAILQRLKAGGATDIDEEYVCISYFGKIKTRSTLLTSVKRLCAYAGVPIISFHTLRHQFATMLIEKGVPLEDISNLLGHKSTTTTFDIYCGVMDADTDAREAVSTLLPVEV